MKFKIVISTLVILISVFTGSAQPATSLKSYMQSVRSGKTITVPPSVLNPQNPKAFLQVLALYSKDTLATIRAKTNFIVKSIGMNSKDVLVRQQSVDQLIQAGNDKIAGNVSEVFNHLTQFEKEDFTKTAKDSLQNLFYKRPTHLDQLVRLAGFLEITSLQSELQSLSQPGNNQRDRLAALLALARMGDVSATTSVVERTRKLKLNNDVVYEVFRDLLYTRQREAINYMIEVLQSNEKECESSDNDNPVPIPCGYRVMEQLASVIEGYPLKQDASGDINTKDYKQALITVRDWFKQNGDNYKIDKSKF